MGYFFDHQDSTQPPATHINSLDMSQEISSIHAELVTGPKFYKLPTAWVGFLLIVLFIGFAIALFVLQLDNVNWFCSIYPLFHFFLVLHVSLWLIVFVADRYLQYAHHISQSLGYLQLFRDTKDIRRLPYNMLNLGNAVLLIITAVLGHQGTWSGLTLINILQIIFVLEMVVVVPGIIWYLAKVIKFNRTKPHPDAEDTEFLNGFTAAAAISQSVSETGFRDGEYLDDVLEKQADMIRYLQQHNANLGRRLMHLIQLKRQQTAPSTQTPDNPT
ncbi:hypothetical protein QZH41_013161 [Actinostola sp. cb2023]|nr:hypothetical protein QZH41_013161 [Actinostola sp. cb2023]